MQSMKTATLNHGVTFTFDSLSHMPLDVSIYDADMPQLLDSLNPVRHAVAKSNLGPLS